MLQELERRIWSKEAESRAEWRSMIEKTNPQLGFIYFNQGK